VRNVTFTGRLNREQIPLLLATIDACLVHLKKRDLFTTVMPSKIFEAAAMAKPIVLGVGGHAADLVQRAGCGICIEPENETELVGALQRMADDRALTASLGEAGREYIVHRFDRGALAADYLELIRRVCGQRGDEADRPIDAAADGSGSAAPRPRELTLAAARRSASLAKAPRVAERA